jgi:glycosyltransferase involved in cell wall biosynthesis
MDKKKPDTVIKVSVCVSTYNQEALIGPCLDSIISQVTDFPIEIIVADDHSTDNTASIIRRYEQLHPHLIRVLIQPVNVGATINLQDVHRLASGAYVAHCDGDDLMLPGKLQKQADFLDAHPDIVQTWHRMYLIDKEGNRIGILPRRFLPLLSRKLTIRDLAVAYFMLGFHSSLMYRREARTVNDRKQFTIDYFYALETASHGYSTHMRDFLGCYRTVPNSSLTTSGSHIQHVDTAMAEAALYFGKKFPELGPMFYGNLWFKRKLLIYAGTEVSAEFKKIFSYFWQYRNRRYPMRSTWLFMMLYSSLSVNMWGKLIRKFSRPLK